MAKSINNPIMQGATGRVGKLTFRRTIFGTVIANLPDYEKKKGFTPKQLAYRKRFKLGTEYIKAKMEDPLFKERYASIAKPGVSAYMTAFADFMSPPKINLLDKSAYSGLTGDTILVDATDNFGVESVFVSITGLRGGVLESGLATFNGPDLNWVYTASTAHADVTGFKIEVTVSDFSGAKTTESIFLS